MELGPLRLLQVPLQLQLARQPPQPLRRLQRTLPLQQLLRTRRLRRIWKV